jgi:hypothetical protein
MTSDSSYVRERLRMVAEAASKGHRDPCSLRELLIYTTDTNTGPIALAYFAQHREYPDLLRSLVNIALKGEHAGDAPWAAANIIADYPAKMLLPHKGNLEQLAREQWTYLHEPAKRALAKIAMAYDGGR